MSNPPNIDLTKEEKTTDVQEYKFDHIIKFEVLLNTIRSIKSYNANGDLNYIAIQFFDSHIITVSMCLFDSVINKKNDTPYSLGDALLCTFYNNTLKLRKQYGINIPYNKDIHTFRNNSEAIIDLFVPIRYKHCEDLMDFFMHPTVDNAVVLNYRCIGVKIFPHID